MNSRCEKSSDSKATLRNCTEEVLEGLYKNVEMGKNSLVNTVSKVKDTELSAELTAQLSEYSSFGDKIKKILCQSGGEAKMEGMISKITSKISVEMSTIADSSDAHIAQMVIEGTTMGITDNIRLVRDYENSNCSEEALDIARSVVSYQEKCVEKLKKYL